MMQNGFLTFIIWIQWIAAAGIIIHDCVTNNCKALLALLVIFLVAFAILFVLCTKPLFDNQIKKILEKYFKEGKIQT